MRSGSFVPSPDAALGDGDGAARHPYQRHGHSVDAFAARNRVNSISAICSSRREEVPIIALSPNNVGMGCPCGLKRPQGLQDRPDARDFMGAKEIGFPQRGQDGEEWFRATNFLAEIFEGMGQRMAQWEAQFTKPEGI